MEKLVRYRYWWILLSSVLILPGLYFLLLHPVLTTGQFGLGLRAGIDFSGGALWELRMPEVEPTELDTTEVAQIFAESGFESAQVQLGSLQEGLEGTTVVVRTRALSLDDPNAEQERVISNLSAAYGEVLRERLESVGPTVSQESTRSAVIAVFGASVVILIYLTWAFRHAPNPVRYGICAIIAMIHDVLLILGLAAAFGTLFGLEVDAYFLTAMLTILSFSVHDTIVVFDRIRENLQTRHMDETLDDIVNHSIVQTLPRSINTQLTTLFTLTALLLFGGASIRDFVLILLIGLISGTYSSIFNAAQLLVIWEHREWETWFGRGKRSEPEPA